jgi:hypothetical protein
MTLVELLGSLENASKIVITVNDADGVELVTFFAGGYEQILGSLLEREIDTVSIKSNTALVVKLASE